MTLISKTPFSIITDTATLNQFCAKVRKSLLNAAPDEQFITVDTEFARENTYYAQLCLIQIAGPEEAALIDPLAEGIVLNDLRDLFADAGILKVFHAARQDMEVLWYHLHVLPAPLFDTQIAAMVCGFGESIGYEGLVSALTQAKLDKSWQFTNWVQRPLKEAQVEYALGDVVYLRPVYQKLRDILTEKQRHHWIETELKNLTDPQVYRFSPQDAWKRLKPRQPTRRLLGILQAIAAWREEQAQSRNIPRNRLLKDDILLEMAQAGLQKNLNLSRVRGLPKNLSEDPSYAGLLDALERGRALPEEQCPPFASRSVLPTALAPLVDLLGVLLKAKCEAVGIVPRLITNTQDLERFAIGEKDLAFLSGWRHELFGHDALLLKAGKLCLTVRDNQVYWFMTDATV